MTCHQPQPLDAPSPSHSRTEFSHCSVQCFRPRKIRPHARAPFEGPSTPQASGRRAGVWRHAGARWSVEGAIECGRAHQRWRQCQNGLRLPGLRPLSAQELRRAAIGTESGGVGGHGVAPSLERWMPHSTAVIIITPSTHPSCPTRLTVRCSTNPSIQGAATGHRDGGVRWRRSRPSTLLPLLRVTIVFILLFSVC